MAIFRQPGLPAKRSFGGFIERGSPWEDGYLAVLSGQQNAMVILQFVGWPPSKQFVGEILPYPRDPHCSARFTVLPTYTTSPSMVNPYTPGFAGSPGAEKPQNGPSS